MLKYYYIQILLLNLVLNSSNLNGQSDTLVKNIHLDYYLDYYPQFRSIWKPEEKFGYMVADDFTVVLTKVFNSCGYKVNSISNFSGLEMARAGLLPQPLKKSVWIILQMDEKGDVERLEFNNTKPEDQIIDCILQTINGSWVNPAIRYNTPVRCRFYLILN